MSDILIKNMEMPKRCTGCFNSKCLLFFEHTDPNNSRHPNCPLVEVKPHGRIIDADKFITELRATINKVLLGSLLHNIFVNDESVKQDTLDGINFVLDRLENAPTILEASE